MPLLFDMPMEKLKTYEGCTPKPEDFEAYWDRGLQVMRDTDPEVEIRPSDFETPFADCSDLFFTGVGGSRIHAKLLTPKASIPPHPAVLMFHGYTGNAGDWSDKLGYAAMGYTMAILDCRGQGGLSEDRGGVSGTTMRGQIIRGLDDEPDKLLFRQIYLDTAQLAGIIMDMPDVDETRVGAFGMSQGGGLTLACAALEPRIRRAAPLFPFLCDYRRVWDLDLAKDAYWELQQYFRHFDPRHEREDEIFTKLGYIDVQHLAPRIEAEIMMGMSLMDTVCPPSTQFAAYNKIRSEKSLVVYPDYGHEGIPGHSDTTFQFLATL